MGAVTLQVRQAAARAACRRPGHQRGLPRGTRQFSVAVRAIRAAPSSAAASELATASERFSWAWMPISVPGSSVSR